MMDATQRRKLKAKQFAPVLVVAMALFAVGCGTMEVTTIADANHPRDLGEPVLFRVTFRDTPTQAHSAIPRNAELSVQSPVAVILADSTL